MELCGYLHLSDPWPQGTKPHWAHTWSEGSEYRQDQLLRREPSQNSYVVPFVSSSICRLSVRNVSLQALNDLNYAYSCICNMIAFLEEQLLLQTKPRCAQLFPWNVRPAIQFITELYYLT